MTSNAIFVVNGRIEVSWEDQYFKSNIEDIEEETLAISIPIKEGQYLPLRRGERLEVIYYLEDERYKFNSVVQGRRIDGIPVILISKPKNLELIQRRKFVRVPLLSQIKCSRLDKSMDNKSLNQHEASNGISANGIVLDLSGGGMKIKLKEELNLNDKVLINLNIEDEELALNGEVVRVELMEDKDYLYGVNFIEIDNRTTEKLIRYIFHVMRNQMKKI